MKKLFALLLAFSLLLLCGCDKGEADSFDTSSSSTTEQTTDSATAWEPDLYQSWNYDPAFPSGDYSKMYNFGDPSTYDMDFHLEPDVFSVSDFPEEVSVIIENRNGTPFVMRLGSTFLIEKKYRLPDDIIPKNDSEITPYSSVDTVNDVWVRLPARYANADSHWIETARADLNHKTDIKKYVNSVYIFMPGEYRLVFYTLAGAHYAYFTVTE